MSDQQDYFSQLEELDDGLLSSFPMPQGPSTQLGTPDSGPMGASVSNAGGAETGASHLF
jgi:hypothetical protein